MFSSPPGGATEYIAYRSVQYMDFLSYDNQGYLYPGPCALRTKSQLNKLAKHTTFYKFEEGISFAEHWKLVAGSSEFHLTLKRAHRVHFSNSKYSKKAGHFK